jgi:AraC-like DNA-binding protein
VPEKRFGLGKELCFLAYLNQCLLEDGRIGIQFVEISAAAPAIAELVRRESEELSSWLHSLLERDAAFVRERPMDAVSRMNLRAVMEAIAKLAMPRMYLEGKSLELLAESLHPQYMSGSHAGAAPSMRKDDLEKILLAREILLSMLDRPPSLKELSKKAGINEFKLKNGFKELFGTTVYRLLRDKRLERARALLEQDRLNVSEAACAVGYSNPSHFAAAFKEKYGVNPSEVVTQFNRIAPADAKPLFKVEV